MQSMRLGRIFAGAKRNPAVSRALFLGQRIRPVLTCQREQYRVSELDSARKISKDFVPRTKSRPSEMGRQSKPSAPLGTTGDSLVVERRSRFVFCRSGGPAVALRVVERGFGHAIGALGTPHRK